MEEQEAQFLDSGEGDGGGQFGDEFGNALQALGLQECREAERGLPYRQAGVGRRVPLRVKLADAEQASFSTLSGEDAAAL